VFGVEVPNGRVVTVPVVGGVVVVVVVLERPGSQILKLQNSERVIGADSGPDKIKMNRIQNSKDIRTTKFCSTCNT